MQKRYTNSRYVYQDDDGYDSYESKKQKKKESPPRFTKNCMDKVDTDQIVVNLSKTHYDIIQTVVEELGWVAQFSKKSQKWDIMWTDNHIDAQDLFRLNNHQKISHFPAIEVLSKKNFLGRSLMKMGKAFPQQYNFFPSTWSIPSQIGELMRYDAQHSEEQNKIYIFKPEASSQGKGISLVSNLQQIEGKTGIVQVYINNPYLVQGLKFDMRVYVLIYGMDPMRIYIYEEGLARFATQSYQKAKKKNLKDNFVHLTNYAINKNNKKFIFNTSERQMHLGHKRSITSIYNILKRKEVDVATIKAKIDAIIVKTLLVGKPMLNHLYGLSQTDNLANDHCFHILGFDVMLDEHLEPFLLQVNHTPSFATDTPLDKNIKKNLIKETLLLLNVSVQTKKIKIQKKLEFDKKRSMRQVYKLTPQEKIEQKKLIEKQKNAHEANTMKKYRKLYPQEGKQYPQLQQCAQKIFNQQYGIKNKQINREKEVRQARDISSPVKPLSTRQSPTKQPSSRQSPTKQPSQQSPNQQAVKPRPRSIQQISTESKLLNKIKPRITSCSVATNSSTAFPEPLQKLPEINISPKKKVQEKSSTISGTKKFVKSYQFNPETLFAQYKEKINLQKVYLKQRMSQIKGQAANPPPTATVTEIPKPQQKKEGLFIEPKILNLTDNMSIPFRQYDEVSIEPGNKSFTKFDKTKHRNFNDFTMLSTKEKDGNFIANDKSPVLLVRKQAQRKQSPYRYPMKIQIGEVQREAEELLLLKSLTSKPGNFM